MSWIVNAEHRTSQAVVKSFPASSSSLQPARTFVTEWVRANGGDDELVIKAELISSELVSNAVEATRAAEFQVALHCTDELEYALAVTNVPGESRVPLPQDWHPDAVLAAKGRGLLIVAHLADRVEVEQEDSAITVTAYLVQ